MIREINCERDQHLGVCEEGLDNLLEARLDFILANGLGCTPLLPVVEAVVVLAGLSGLRGVAHAFHWPDAG